MLNRVAQSVVSNNGRKRKSKYEHDTIEISLSDLEEDREPISVKCRVEDLSEDRRRVAHCEHHVSVHVEKMAASVPLETPADDYFFDLGTIDIEAVQSQKTRLRKSDDSRRQRYVSSDQPLKNWIPLRDEYLDELIRLEGRGAEDQPICPTCKGDPAVAEPLYRCQDCLYIQPRCSECLLAAHQHLPFHRIEKWNGTFFVNTTLQALGLVVQVGHAVGDTCSNPIPARQRLVVISTNGIHPVTLRYCGCDRQADAGNHRQQLLRARLYPATDQEPMTCATFAVLEATHMQNVQAKSGVYDLYKALERLTDNTGLRKVRNCYKAFLRMVRQWKHLKMLKRAGRAHDPAGVAGTKEGELVVECPACPRPGVNIPDDWQSVREDMKYLYWMYVSLDACFRIKRYDISDAEKDPVLDDGMAYFVKRDPYKEQLKKYKNQNAMSTCTGLAALDHADTKFSKGYDATGIGACIDGRHEFMLPNGVGDLQKGERHINMDYVYSSSLRHFSDIDIMTMYDIVCQWAIHLEERMADMPEDLRTQVARFKELRYAIGKLHWHGHKKDGHSRFSLNYLFGSGRTDGEGIERRWWDIQPVANSTKMMGPGGREAALNDVWGFANWMKTIGLPSELCRKFMHAVQQAKEQEEEFEAFSRSFSPATIDAWEKMVTEWEHDHEAHEDPYVAPQETVTEAQVKRTLAQEEEERVRTGKKTALHDVSPSSFLTIGLELEEQQRVLRRDAARESKTTTGATKTFESRTTLTRRIARFREIQAVYMPIVPSLLDADITQETAASAPTTTLPASDVAVAPLKQTVQLAEHIPLMLPSGVLKTERDPPPTRNASRTSAGDSVDSSDKDPGSSSRPTPVDSSGTHEPSRESSHAATPVKSSPARSHTPEPSLGPSPRPGASDTVATARRLRRQRLMDSFAPDLVDAEKRLRQAQCGDALEDLRTKIHIRGRFRQYKRLNVRNQHRNQRANDTLNKIETRLQFAADKYRAARDALCSLVGDAATWATDFAPTYPELRNEDVRPFDEDDPGTKRKKGKMRKTAKKQIAEGSRKVSWIWRGASTTDSEGISAGVRVEWMKARARCKRWGEELKLLPEEMRRTVTYHSWKAEWWAKRAALRREVSAPLQEGLAAYAGRQAAIRRGLSAQADVLWKSTMRTISKRASAESDNAAGGPGDLPSDDEDLDLDEDEDDEDEDGVQGLEESDAVIAFMELDFGV
ncbi:CxC2 domain-containing protein [Phanerochaete sordida]|uniref:CxC2 domain-containing protein n=1 Tax=Phanerochaete sordida TaxID=48140 RepID=A0A9P3LKC5_9APHY|nr:CxC2 domain-containing protein [Phanerochaete sordida]